jgi:hypothetical protein
VVSALSDEGTGGPAGENDLAWTIEYIGEETGFGGRDERVYHWRFSHGGIRSIDVRFVVASAEESHETSDLAADRARPAAELLAREASLNRYRWWVSDDAITSVDGVRIERRPPGGPATARSDSAELP